MGVRVLIVDAKDAAAFYQVYGFRSKTREALALYLPV